MDEHPSRSWQPDRAWADPLIALLALLALLAVGFTLRVRQQGARRPSERVSLQGRLTEVALAGPKLLTGAKGRAPEWAKAERQLKEPWDRALLAVLKAELRENQNPGDAAPEAAAPAGPAGEPYRRACLAAYAGAPLPGRAERDEVHRRLGDGYAADLLEARLLDRESGGEALRANAEAPRGSGDALRAAARGALLVRLAGLGLMGLVLLGLAAGGLAMGLYLSVTREQARPALPVWSMSGRAAAIVLLTWFLAFFLSGNLALLLLQPWPGQRWLAVPLSYLFHAAFGISLLCRAEGLRASELWRRVAPGRPGRDLAWGAGFLALALFLVMVVALVWNAVAQPEQNAQRDLQELLRGLSGWAPNLILFGTVAGLAPVFEELLFRGFLLPLLARRGRLAWALALSALLFGAIHLQPLGLPILCTLGFALGLAMRHTASLRTPILVHACWNGGLFLLMRAFA
jgi:membrane protease YdiL (CAAX protease family)